MDACLDYDKDFLFSKCHTKDKSFRFYFISILSLLRTFFDTFFEYKWSFILFICVYFVLWLVYRNFWKHPISKKELIHVGFDHITGPHKEMKMSLAQKHRHMGQKIPPPYPNGWFSVAESDEVKIGTVLPVDALGQNLCVYRGWDGVARAVHAYCPHLGASLAVGGAVRGKCIECPFHKWRFDEDGICVSVPGENHAPKGVSIRKWHTVEAAHAIWIWHDAERREPLWPFWVDPALQGMGYRGRNECIVGAHVQRREPLWPFWVDPALQGMGYRGRNECIVGAHVQDITENGADAAHLNIVHSTSLVTRIAEKYPFLKHIVGYHEWTGNWVQDGYNATITMTQDYRLFGVNVAHADVDISQRGPGLTFISVRSSYGHVVILHSVTPVGPTTQKIVHRVYSHWSKILIASITLKSEIVQFERDVELWNWKRYAPAPAFCKADKNIRIFRKWFEQFYSKNSLSYKDAMMNNLDW